MKTRLYCCLLLLPALAVASQDDRPGRGESAEGAAPARAGSDMPAAAAGRTDNAAPAGAGNVMPAAVAGRTGDAAPAGAGSVMPAAAAGRTGNAAPVGPGSDQPAASCRHCAPEEQLIVDLNYYQQVLVILGEIDEQRKAIDPSLLQSLNAALLALRPGLESLLRPAPVSAPAAAPPPAAKPAPPPAAKPGPRPARAARPRSRPPQGITGLVVGHAQEANEELGIKAGVVLVINNRPRSLNIGSVIQHNRRKWKITQVKSLEDAGGGKQHQVHLQDLGSGKTHILPWQ